MSIRRWHLLPHDGVLTGLVFGFSFHTDHLHSTSVQRCRNAHLFKTFTSYIIWQTFTNKPCENIMLSRLQYSDLYFLCQERGLEIRFDDNFDLQLCASNLSNQWNDPEGQNDVLSGAIPARADWRRVKTKSDSGVWRQTDAELTSWAHILHQEGWNWCCAQSRTCWDAHTDGKCSRRWLWTVCHWWKWQRNEGESSIFGKY